MWPRKKTEQHECNEKFWLYCKSTSHSSTDKACPEQINHQKIKKIIAERNIPYSEAKKFASGNYTTFNSPNRYEALNFSDTEAYPALAPTTNRQSINITSKIFTFTKQSKKQNLTLHQVAQ